MKPSSNSFVGALSPKVNVFADRVFKQVSKVINWDHMTNVLIIRGKGAKDMHAQRRGHVRTQ